MTTGSFRKLAPAKNASDHHTPYSKRTSTKPITNTHPASTVSHKAMHGRTGKAR
jgi:hypothetical protein